ncbi:glycoside hydrolase family 65 protein [Bacillus massilinigeriensis]|uniref:glycoside hydrolase family 65 protein n=1 Tax=Bacillus massilionigeriensis TaxID=1805475 RepID=UPI00096B443C|nr:glycosyl hydrolase family 65 protein [Bacillus massilionigeriensis]
MSWAIKSENYNLDNLLIEESLFSTGNGYLGVRGNFEEGYTKDSKTIRGTYINAFHDIVEIPYGEKHYGFPDTQQKLLNIIDSQTVLIALEHDGIEEWFSIFGESGDILSYERKLHLDKGFTERIVHWRSPSGKEVKLHFKRLVSLTNLELFIQEIIIEPINYKGKVKICSVVNGDVSNYIDPTDPRVASGHAKRLQVTNIQVEKEIPAIEVETLESKLKSACSVTYDINRKAEIQHVNHDLSISSTFSFHLLSKTVFTKRSVFTDTLRHGDQPIQKAIELQKEISFEGALREQETYLSDFWSHADIQIKGDLKLQEGIRFNLYHLLQSTGRDPHSNIAAKGLSGEGYEGHYFWDTEIFIFPVFLLTKPELAKQLLLYRYSILDAARDHAKEMGHKKGALFPWRTISGTECSSYYPSGSAQYHISADIAYSFIQYFFATQDHDFLKDFGSEVLIETARLWLEVGHFDQDQFKIDAVTGPDEYTCLINNNYYTNVMAKHNLTFAAKAYWYLKYEAPVQYTQLQRRIGIGDEEALAWERAAQHMYLPYDENLGINPQDDSFLHKAVWDFDHTPDDHYPLLLHYHPLTLYRYQVCKQADTVLAHFLLEDEQDFQIMKKSFDYYEKVTTHDSSLSTCIFSIMASKIGYFEKAYNYFIETARLDLDNTHGNTKDGLHMANMGGAWMAIVFGFAGLRIKETGLSFTPSIPEKWESLSFPIQFQGSMLRVTIKKDRISLIIEKGDSLTIKIYEVEYIVGKNQTTEIMLRKER